MQIEIDLFYLLVCFAVSSFFGILSLLAVFVLSFNQQAKIRDALGEIRGNNAVAISGNGNKYKE